MNDVPRPGAFGLTPLVRTVIAGVLTALLLAAVIVGTISFRNLQDAQDDADNRRDAIRVAQQFAASFNTYKPESLDAYRKSVNQVLSTNGKTAFKKTLDELVGAVAEAKLKSEGEVVASGVTSIDRDSARVLVVADAKAESVFGVRQRHFRWEVELVKVDGAWLVDDFTPVA